MNISDIPGKVVHSYRDEEIEASCIDIDESPFFMITVNCSQCGVLITSHIHNIEDDDFDPEADGLNDRKVIEEHRCGIKTR